MRHGSNASILIEWLGCQRISVSVSKKSDNWLQHLLFVLRTYLWQVRSCDLPEGKPWYRHLDCNFLDIIWLSWNSWNVDVCLDVHDCLIVCISKHATAEVSSTPTWALHMTFAKMKHLRSRSAHTPMSWRLALHFGVVTCGKLLASYGEQQGDLICFMVFV